MAFPEEPLGLLAEILVGGQWEKLPLYTRSPLTHQRGIRDEGTVADPAAVPMTINNKDGKYSPRNPMSPYYGKIGRNTRVRLSLPSVESYLQLDGAPTTYASTPDHASLDITGDLDVRWEGEADWYTPVPTFLIGKWGAALNRSWALRVEAGMLRFGAFVTPVETARSFVSFAPLPALPRRAALRVTADVDNGAGGVTTRFYSAPSLAGPWTQFGGDLIFTGFGPVTLVNSTAALEIAPYQTDSDPDRERMAGRVYRAEVRNGINGTVVARPDFTVQAAGTTAFTDSAGRAWSLSGDAEIRDRVDRFIGEISEWPQKWEPSEADAWVPVQASGILRRLNQGTKPLDSALRRRIPSYNPLAYWPMEEGEAATRAYSPLPGGEPLTLTNVQWAADSSLASSAPLPTLNGRDGAYSDLFGWVINRSWASLPAWSVVWMYHMPQIPPNRRTYMMVYTTGTVREWYVQQGPDTARLWGVGYEGETIVDRTIDTGTDIFGKWVKARFAVEQQGSNIRYAIVWTDVNGSAGSYENTVPGVTGRPTGVSAPPGGYHPDVNGMAIGHISVWPTFDTDAYDNAIVGWSGEAAGARMQRLVSEEGIPLTVTGPPTTTEPVGGQAMKPVLDLVKTATDADGGMLTEDQTALRLLYRPRATLYSQTPALILDYAQGQVAAPLEPVDDDSDLRNDVTVTREGGSSTRVVLESGPLSVQDPPAGVGVYDDAITLSLATDEQTGPKAYWELHLGTWDEPRYPAVTVNLHRHPELIPQVLALREGDVIRLEGMPKWVAPDDVDLMVMGLKETLLPRKWTITFDCVPAGPWQVGVLGDAVLGRVDTDGSQLAAAVDADDTTVPVTMTAGPAWTTDPAALPFGVRVGGEVMTVNAVTGTAEDSFTRTVTGGWGTAASGQSWTAAGGTLATDYDVTGGVGRHVGTSRNVFRSTSLPVQVADVDLTVTVAIPVMPTGDALYAFVLARTDPTVTSYYMARLTISTAGTTELSLRKRTPGEALLATAAASMTHVAGQAYRVRLKVAGSQLSAKAWRAQDTEPADWQVTATDTALPGPGGIGLRSLVPTGNTNALPIAITWDNLTSSPQMLHVTRSVNGITKPHVAGADVRLAAPSIVAL
jgi:hypothetical protein